MIDFTLILPLLLIILIFIIYLNISMREKIETILKKLDK